MKFRNEVLDWEVPLDYFREHPKFPPFIVPWTGLAVVVVEDDGAHVDGVTLDVASRSAIVLGRNNET